MGDTVAPPGDEREVSAGQRPISPHGHRQVGQVVAAGQILQILQIPQIPQIPQILQILQVV
ncbi:hypothetical protein [Streptomyces sp900129855]|uniref:Uncharacterized protein n=1 Tax=Streptomyces sp. 900129855 TaxID=3155129 RepID=A0ABV2ZBD8_9ACTN